MYAASLDAMPSIPRPSQQAQIQTPNLDHLISANTAYDAIMDDQSRTQSGICAATQHATQIPSHIATKFQQEHCGNASSTQSAPTWQMNSSGSKQSTFTTRNHSILETETMSPSSVNETSGSSIRIPRFRGQSDMEYHSDYISESMADDQTETKTLYNALRTPMPSTLPDLQHIRQRINATNGQLKDTVEQNSNKYTNGGKNQAHDDDDVNNDSRHQNNSDSRNGQQTRTSTTQGSRTPLNNGQQFNIVRTKRVVSPEQSTTTSSKKSCNKTQKQCHTQLNTDQHPTNSPSIKQANESKHTSPPQQVFDVQLTTPKSGHQVNQTRLPGDEPYQRVSDKDLPAFAFYKWPMFGSPNDPIFFIAVYSSEWGGVKIILHLVTDTMSQDYMKGLYTRGIKDAKMMSPSELEQYLCKLYQVQAAKLQESAQKIAEYQQKPFSIRLKQYSDPSLQIFHKPTITLSDIIDLERKNKDNFDIMVKSLAEEKRLNTRRSNDAARRSLEKSVQHYEIQARMEEYLERLHVGGHHPTGEQVHEQFGLLYARLHSMIQTNLPKYELATQIINNPDQMSFANKMVTAILEFRNFNTDQFFA